MSGVLKRIWRRLRGTRQSPARIALAVAIGAFIGCLPVYGLHFFLCAALCLPFGLDLVLAYLVANVSNPLFAPFLLSLEVEIGSLLLTGQHAAFSVERAKRTGILGFAQQAALGSVLVGAGLAALGSAIAFFVARRKLGAIVESDAEVRFEAAVARTIARYAGLPRAHRFPVLGKLRLDPLTKMLAELPPSLGRVLDAGAGRGQFGLFLLELGAADSVHGFDADARKVAAAQAASGEAARFEVRDLLDLPAERVDTLLLLDVLHYLPLSEQDQLLGKAAQRVERGRILVRELDAAPGMRSWMTRLMERLAELTGVHRGRAQRHYRPIADIVARLRALGFECSTHGASEGTPFGNVLVVAERSAATDMRSSTGTG